MPILTRPCAAMATRCDAPGDDGEKTRHHAAMIRWFGTIGALFGFAGVLLAAMASHVLAAKLGLDDLRRVSLAATFCFVQGAALVSLACAMRQVRGLVLAIAG